MGNTSQQFIFDGSSIENYVGIRKFHDITIEDMSERTGFEIEDLLRFENGEELPYQRALKCAYYNQLWANSDNSKSALHEIFKLFPNVKEDSRAKDILEELELFDLLEDEEVINEAV